MGSPLIQALLASGGLGGQAEPEPQATAGPEFDDAAGLLNKQLGVVGGQSNVGVGPAQSLFNALFPQAAAGDLEGIEQLLTQGDAGQVPQVQAQQVPVPPPIGFMDTFSAGLAQLGGGNAGGQRLMQLRQMRQQALQQNAQARFQAAQANARNTAQAKQSGVADKLGLVRALSNALNADAAGFRQVNVAAGVARRIEAASIMGQNVAQAILPSMERSLTQLSTQLEGTLGGGLVGPLRNELRSLQKRARAAANSKNPEVIKKFHQDSIALMGKVTAAAMKGATIGTAAPNRNIERTAGFSLIRSTSTQLAQFVQDNPEITGLIQGMVAKGTDMRPTAMRFYLMNVEGLTEAQANERIEKINFFNAMITNMNSHMVQMISGAQVAEAEFTRLQQFMADIKQDPRTAQGRLLAIMADVNGKLTAESAILRNFMSQGQIDAMTSAASQYDLSLGTLPSQVFGPLDGGADDSFEARGGLGKSFEVEE